MIRAIRQVINPGVRRTGGVRGSRRPRGQALLAHVSPAIEHEFGAGFEPPEKAMETA